MSTSNSTAWSLNRDQVITAALRKLAVIPSGGTPTSAQISDAADSLNALVKILQADGMPLWKIDSTTFSTVAGTINYTVGVGQTINIPKPLKIVKAISTPLVGDSIPMDLLNRYDFLDLPSSASGMPLTLLYAVDRIIGTVSLWPNPDAVYTITFLYQSPFEDMNASANDFDFPSEWVMPLIYMLAWVLAPEYGVPPIDRGVLQKEAEYWHQYALSMGSEEGSVFVRPNVDY